MRSFPKALIGFAAVFLSSCGGGGRAPETSPESLRAYCGDDYEAVEARIDDLLEQLTLEQKVAMTAGRIGGPLWNVPGVPELGIPNFSMIDGPRGAGVIAGDATAFPVEMARGATFDPELERRVGQTIAHETRAYGRNVLLAPTMNVLRHPRWGRAQETYGEDPFHIGSMAVGFVEGAQTEIPVTAKHFALNSIENTRFNVDVSVDERTLREVYLPHFRRVVQDAHVASIMSAYNSVNGLFCSENGPLLNDILKGEWDFAGFVVSDWGGTQTNMNGREHTIASAFAGLDIEMFAAKLYGNTLHDAVLEGEVPERIVDEIVRRVLRARFCFDLDTNPPVRDETQVDTPAARALAREVAERSFVLLENEGGALPIDRTTAPTIVVTGPLADVENIGDTGSSNVSNENIVTMLEGLSANAGAATVTHLDHVPASPADDLIVSEADAVVVVVGLTEEEEGEAQIGAGDRASLDLPADDVAWIEAVAAHSSRVIVVVEAGSAITLGPILDDVEAVLYAWYPGVEGGNALARTVFGEVNPSGRLPIVFPASDADLPVFDNVSHSVTYGYFHGYKHLDHEGLEPLYPFGFGLSYTTFAYSELSVANASLTETGTVEVSVRVLNTGTRAGRETVQVYFGAQGSSVTPRFERELRAFAQVELDPGESQTVSLAVPVAELAYWDAAAHAFRVEPGTYRVEVGPHSRALALTTDITVVAASR